jgi:hypothetical protein
MLYLTYRKYSIKNLSQPSLFQKGELLLTYHYITNYPFSFSPREVSRVSYLVMDVPHSVQEISPGPDLLKRRGSNTHHFPVPFSLIVFVVFRGSLEWIVRSQSFMPAVMGLKLMGTLHVLPLEIVPHE